VPKRTLCALRRNSAEAGLSSFSAINVGFAAALVDDFFNLGFPFAPSFSDADLEVDLPRRAGFFEALMLVGLLASFNGTLMVVAVVVRTEKKSLVTGATTSAFADLGAYCSVTRSVMVRGFFLGAFPFSGDDCRDTTWLLARSTSYIRVSMTSPELH